MHPLSWRALWIGDAVLEHFWAQGCCAKHLRGSHPSKKKLICDKLSSPSKGKGVQEILLEPRHCRVPSLTRCLKLMNKQCTHDQAPVITVTAHMPSPHVSHLERGWCKSPNVTVRGMTNIKLSHPPSVSDKDIFLFFGRGELSSRVQQ